MLTSLEPIVTLAVRGLELVGPHVVAPTGHETQTQTEDGHLVILPAGLPSARRIRSRSYEPEVSDLLRSTLTRGATFVDGGANIGYYALLAGQLVGPTGHVYAFEPEPVAFKYLQANILSSGLSWVIPHQGALADRPGSRLFVPSLLEGGFLASEIPGPREGVEVEADSLDHFFSEKGWPKVDLIKIDVEGAELSVLMGMKELVKRNPGVRVVMEFNRITLKRAGGTPAKLSHVLDELGFMKGTIIELGRHIDVSAPLPDSRFVYNVLLER
jgi:FkbM family methyltransferase